jgi:hypothetical protein
VDRWGERVGCAAEMRSGAVEPLEQAPRGGCIPLDPLGRGGTPYSLRGPPCCEAEVAALKSERRGKQTPYQREPPRWSVAEVSDPPFEASFLMFDKGPAALPGSRRGPSRTALG